MPSTHTSLNIHAVFSTKERRPLIKDTFKDDLFGYLGGIVKNQNAVPLEIGGIDDHIHMLLGIKPTMRIDHLIREIKACSSGWLRNERRSPFQWQTGYGAFSVSPDRVDGVKDYIRNQEAHHKGIGYKDEYLTILDASGVPYDPQYLW
jgi:REP element-mobilizing transposase RayT